MEELEAAVAELVDPDGEGSVNDNSENSEDDMDHDNESASQRVGDSTNAAVGSGDSTIVGLASSAIAVPGSSSMVVPDSSSMVDPTTSLTIDPASSLMADSSDNRIVDSGSGECSEAEDLTNKDRGRSASAVESAGNTNKVEQCVSISSEHKRVSLSNDVAQFCSIRRGDSVGSEMDCAETKPGKATPSSCHHVSTNASATGSASGESSCHNQSTAETSTDGASWSSGDAGSGPGITVHLNNGHSGSVL